MKIGFLTSSLSSEDGWGRYSKSLIESVADHAEVMVLLEKDARNESGLPVADVLPAGRFHPVAQWQIKKACKQYLADCDLIHILIEPYAPGAARAAISLGIPYLMTLHGTYSVPPKEWWSLRRYQMIHALSHAAMTTTGSRYTEEKAREQIKFGECRFIPNGVDTSVFNELPNVQRKQMILTTGAVKPRKGADLVVEALGLLKEEFPDLTYEIAGTLGNEGFVQKIRARSAELGIEDRVQLRGIVSDDELVRLYNTCSVFVLAARDQSGQFEGFPMVFYEANACGAPVITTKGFGSEYAIHDGKNGYLVPQEDPKAIADTLRTILLDSDLQQNLHKGALSEAARHTWERIAADHLMPMYRDTVSSAT